uniref:EF-hand domain-containing protein n=1 Tax=Monodelphis domestica TaxID=13616 RepID=F6QSH6_MONDO
MELKLMMEKLGDPLTHLGLKEMIREVDEDLDSKLSFREFLLIFPKAASGKLEEDSGLMSLAKLSEINVAMEGVKGAKNFFEAKVHALSVTSQFEAEIKAEKNAQKQEEKNRKHRRNTWPWFWNFSCRDRWVWTQILWSPLKTSHAH